ncbi:hypothetical protein CBS101457_000639 [Exobasidium rhododendri]|nr:hypothetical protein CBS101457_000639 [Exobasidium rhododendri]
MTDQRLQKSIAGPSRITAPPPSSRPPLAIDEETKATKDSSKELTSRTPIILSNLPVKLAPSIRTKRPREDLFSQLLDGDKEQKKRKEADLRSQEAKDVKKKKVRWREDTDLVAIRIISRITDEEDFILTGLSHQDEGEMLRLSKPKALSEWYEPLRKQKIFESEAGTNCEIADENPSLTALSIPVKFLTNNVVHSIDASRPGTEMSIEDEKALYTSTEDSPREDLGRIHFDMAGLLHETATIPFPDFAIYSEYDEQQQQHDEQQQQQQLLQHHQVQHQQETHEQDHLDFLGANRRNSASDSYYDQNLRYGAQYGDETNGQSRKSIEYDRSRWGDRSKTGSGDDYSSHWQAVGSTSSKCRANPEGVNSDSHDSISKHDANDHSSLPAPRGIRGQNKPSSNGTPNSHMSYYPDRNENNHRTTTAERDNTHRKAQNDSLRGGWGRDRDADRFSNRESEKFAKDDRRWSRKIACRHYNTPQGCKKGSYCDFLHQ